MTVRLHTSYQRNRPGDICGFSDEVESQLVDKGMATYVADDGELQPDVEPQVEPEPEAEEEDEPAKPEILVEEDDLGDLEYGEIKSLAYAKAAEEGVDIADVLPDQRTETLIEFIMG